MDARNVQRAKVITVESSRKNGPPDIFSSTNRVLSAVTRICQSAFRHDVYHSSICILGRQIPREEKSYEMWQNNGEKSKESQEKGKEEREREKILCSKQKEKKSGVGTEGIEGLSAASAAATVARGREEGREGKGRYGFRRTRRLSTKRAVKRSLESTRTLRTYDRIGS